MPSKSSKAKSSKTDSKAASKASKKVKLASKAERKEKKQLKQEVKIGGAGAGKKGKGKKRDEDGDEDEEDLVKTLEEFRKQWELEHTVVSEIVEGPPSRRANATLTPCPVSDAIWLFGGEYFDGEKCLFYNDLYRFTPSTSEWRNFTSPSAPGPRSAHQVVASQVEGGKLWLFGGEFASQNQTSFHHWKDLWSYHIPSRTWEKIETGKNKGPSARSGHRMTMWKHYIVLFGGFHDAGIRTTYLSDTWLFDTQAYRWYQAPFRESDRVPSPRSGFSFLSFPSASGIVLHGGYCKEYSGPNKKIVKGVALSDTWFLKLELPQSTTESSSPSSMDPKLAALQATLRTGNKSSSKSMLPASAAKGFDPHFPVSLKWEKRKRGAGGFAPSPRSGATMACWANKGIGVLFGGVWDDYGEDDGKKGDEGMESVFFNELYGYQMAGNGRWISLNLKRPKKKGGAGKRRAKNKTTVSSTNAPENEKSTAPIEREDAEEESDDQKGSDGEDKDGKEYPSEECSNQVAPIENFEPAGTIPKSPQKIIEEGDSNDPEKTIPSMRYNAMLAVQRNTLYIYGGIYETPTREYTLDDFHILALDKLDRFHCLRECKIEELEWKESDDEEDDDDDDDDEDEDDGSESESSESGSEGEEEGTGSVDVVKKVGSHEDEDDDGEEKTGKKSRKETPAELRRRAQAFLEGVSKQSGESKERHSAEEQISTPLPGETIAKFYERSREYWAQQAYRTSDNKGKMLRRDGFQLARDRYQEYKPLLGEIEKIRAEAELEEGEHGKGTAGGGLGLASRHRR